jgi:2-oxoisovalerate dehydrogenase E2 component (dihydrolipoyl transacylase)
VRLTAARTTGIAEVEILEWFVKVGDRVQQFDRICAVQSDKATVEITSKFDGVITKIHTPKGSMAQVGRPLVDIDRDGNASEPASKPHGPKHDTPAKQVASKPAQQAVPQQQLNQSINSQLQQQQQSASPQQQQQQAHSSERKARHEIFATPAVRRLAREHNIDLAVVVGSGRDGRILKEDMLNHHSNSGKCICACVPC